MVKFFDRPHHAPNHVTLDRVIQHSLTAHQDDLRAKELTVEIDLARETAVRCSPAVEATIRHMMQHAISRSPQGGELLVTSCSTPRGLEVEIADAGEDAGLPRFSAFRSRDCKNLIGMPHNPGDIDILAASCPQGGMAWTVVVKSMQVISKAA